MGQRAIKSAYDANRCRSTVVLPTLLLLLDLLLDDDDDDDDAIDWRCLIVCDLHVCRHANPVAILLRQSQLLRLLRLLRHLCNVAVSGPNAARVSPRPLSRRQQQFALAADYMKATAAKPAP